MSRALTTPSLRALFAQETGEVFIVLLTVAHSSLATPVRVSSDAVNTVSRGDTYISFPFDLQFPDDTADGPPTARLTIDNVSLEIEANLKKITSPPTVTIEVIRAADPDTVEVSFPGFILNNVKVDAAIVQGDLALEDLATEPFPADTFAPSLFPGIF